MNDRVLLQFQNEEQARHFFNWFKKEGHDLMANTENVEFAGCISSDEEPGATSDPNAFYLEIE